MKDPPGPRQFATTHWSLVGAAMSDAMALGQKLARQGIMVSDMQAILPVAMSFVEQKTGTDQLRTVLESVPGLGPLLTAES